jgi:hypothetical protein
VLLLLSIPAAHLLQAGGLGSLQLLLLFLIAAGDQEAIVPLAWQSRLNGS